jgi:uncharacterized membrane protein
MNAILLAGLVSLPGVQVAVGVRVFCAKLNSAVMMANLVRR